MEASDIVVRIELNEGIKPTTALKFLYRLVPLEGKERRNNSIFPWNTTKKFLKYSFSFSICGILCLLKVKVTEK